MPLRRRLDSATGLGMLEVPYDQSGGGVMPGMEVPQPGGTMKKMSFEFTDPAQAAAAEQAGPQIPQGAGIPPTGAQAPQPQTAMQPPQGDPQGQSPLLASMSQQASGPDSSLFSDQDLASIVGQQDPTQLMGQDLSQQALEGGDPQLQMMLMEAARRQMGV